MKLCFFCYTPFHVFNAINVKCSLYPNDEADLCLYNSMFGKTKVLYDTLVETGLFNDIFFLDNIWWEPETKTEKFLRKRLRIKINKKIKNAFNNYQIIKKRKQIYDEVWSYGSAIEMYIILGLSLKHNPQAKYYGYEEGEGSYRLPCTNVLSDEEKDFLRHRLKIEMPEQPKKMLLYLPTCISPIVTCEVGKMPSVTDRLFSNVYSKVWQIQRHTMTNNIYYMATGSNNQSFTFEMFGRLQADGIDMIVKAHPRFTEPFRNTDIELLDCGSTPWEIVCGTIENIDSKLLIGVYSTAMVTAKSVYGKEPYLIFLNDMDLLQEELKIPPEKEAFLSRFVKTYKNSSKLFFPKNMDELIKCISDWQKKHTLLPGNNEFI